MKEKAPLLVRSRPNTDLRCGKSVWPETDYEIGIAGANGSSESAVASERNTTVVDITTPSAFAYALASA